VHHRTAIFILNNMATKKQVENFNGIDEATDLIELGQPYTVSFTVQGTGKMLMHCWNISSIAEKAAAKKNSTTKKTDDLESYVLRDDQKKIVMPTLNFCAAIREAGKSFSDPTSPRKSMKDRLKAIIIPNEEYGYINGGVTTWDFVDSRRVVIQRAGITRQRPGFYEGWEIEFSIIVLEPEFLPLAKLVEIVDNAGKFQGLGDFRPTFGRFRIKDVHLVE
jgi:hypothetical protein